MTASDPAAELQPTSQTQRGLALEFRRPEEFHECWYPIALSAEIGAGELRGSSFLDGRIVIFRTSDGNAHAVSAYCRHMGADLSLGTLIDDELRCPFHYWRYNDAGRCVATASGDPAPRAARLHAYPTQESLGIIWAFNGAAPPHAPPRFEANDSELLFTAFRNPVTMPVDSSTVFLNAFDIQHFRAVHHLKIEIRLEDMRETAYGLSYAAAIETPEFGPIVQARQLWGVNTVCIESVRGGRHQYLMHSLCPTSQMSTQGFIVNAVSKAAEGNSALSPEQILNDSREFVLRLINEDAPIFATMRLRRDCLTASDKLLAYGMSYITRFPRAHPGRTMIR